MCIKAGRDELESVKNLMAMSLNVVVAGTLGVELEEIHSGARLAEDLGMDEMKAARLKREIAEWFEGVEVDLRSDRTVGELLDRVVLSEFRDIAA